MKKDMDIEEKIEYCAKLRGVYPFLVHRTIFEFGRFLQDMADFLVFGSESDDVLIRQFQRELESEKRRLDPEKFSAYIDLFVEFWEKFDELSFKAYHKRCIRERDEE